MLATAEVQVTWVDANDDELNTPLNELDARLVVEGMPVREFPVYVGRRNYSGRFWSATMGSHIAYE